jgi:hypothetical protein
MKQRASLEHLEVKNDGFLAIGVNYIYWLNHPQILISFPAKHSTADVEAMLEVCRISCRVFAWP